MLIIFLLGGDSRIRPSTLHTAMLEEQILPFHIHLPKIHVLFFMTARALSRRIGRTGKSWRRF